MTCGSCVKDVSDSLYKLGGITKVDASLPDQLVTVEGTGILSLPLRLEFCSILSICAADISTLSSDSRTIGNRGGYPSHREGRHPARFGSIKQ
jgi:hypothetical protein